MKSVLTASLLALSLACAAPAAWAQDAPASSSAFTLSGGADVKTSYVFNDLYVSTDAPVIQPYGQITHNPSGLYYSVWGSTGFTTKAGQEIDHTVGIDRQVSKEVSVGGFVAYDDLQHTGDDIVNFQAHATVGKWTVRADYYDWLRNQDGRRITVEYADRIGKVGVKALALHEQGLGFDPMTAGGVTLSYPLGAHLDVTLTGLAPLHKSQNDPRTARVVVGLGYHF